MPIEEDLRQNLKEFLESANDALNKQRYNAAVDAFFKAIVIMCDLEIYHQRHLLPKNHSERFLFLKMHFNTVYEKVNPLFSTYTKLYNLRMEKKDAEVLKENVSRIKELLGIKKEDKEV